MDDLTETLQRTLKDLKEVMAQRRKRAETLKAEIEQIELQNEQLEQAVQELLKDF